VSEKSVPFKVFWPILHMLTAPEPEGKLIGKLKMCSRKHQCVPFPMKKVRNFLERGSASSDSRVFGTRPPFNAHCLRVV